MKLIIFLTCVVGKGESTFDRFVHTRSEHIVDRSTGDVACNTYNLFREDTALLADLGVNNLLLQFLKASLYTGFIFSNSRNLFWRII